MSKSESKKHDSQQICWQPLLSIHNLNYVHLFVADPLTQDTDMIS